MHGSHQAGSILADAFLHYPLMDFAFEGKTAAQQQLGLLHLYTACTNACSTFGGVQISDDQQGALVWLSGNNFPLGLVKELRAGMLRIPFALGVKTTLRLMRHDAVAESWIRQHAGNNMGYIWCLGVRNQARGKGISRVLIEAAIEKMKSEGLDEFWLKTEDPKNVIVYQKSGFELMFETVVKSSGIKTWVMMRK